MSEPVGRSSDEPAPGMLHRAIRFCLLAFIGLRLAMFAVALVGVDLVDPLEPVSVPGWPGRPAIDGGRHDLFGAWERFDALWFLRIADAGYRVGDGSAAFFPLYPLSIRAVVSVLGGAPLAAATIVSNTAFVGGLVSVYLLTVSELDEGTARTTVLLLCSFPTAHFFLMPYAESLFLLLAASTFLAARRSRWTLAAGAGALAALTRSIGIALAPALLIEALHQRAEGRTGSWWPVAAAAGPALGLLSYLAYWGIRTGDWLAPASEQSGWQRRPSFPLTTLWDATRAAFTYLNEPGGGYWLVDWLIVIPMLAASVYAAIRLRPSYAVYLWGGLLIPLSFVFAPRPLLSMPRFLLPLFPAFWGLALGLERLRIPRAVAVAAGVLGLGVLSVLTVNWLYIF